MNPYQDVWYWALTPTMVVFVSAVIFSCKRKIEVKGSSIFGLIGILLFELPRLGIVCLPQPGLGLPQLTAWILGGIIFLIGWTFAVVGVLQIRFGAAKEPNKKRELKTSGFYSLVRHPIYLGDILWPIGWSIIFNAQYALTLTPLWFILLYLLTFVEEERLVDEYGETYENYRKNTARLVPGIK